MASQQARDYPPGRGWTAPLEQRRQTTQRRTMDQTMVSFQSGGVKDAKTLQSRLVATLAALSTLGDAPSRPTMVFRVATGPLHRLSPIALQGHSPILAACRLS